MPEEQSISGHVESEHDAKRRKLRKGTRSCWECKRRKVRCVFTLPSDEICVACRRRGGHCISQEFPEEFASDTPTDDNQGPLADRLSRVESLLGQLVKQVIDGPARAGASDLGVLTPSPTVLSEPLPHNQDIPDFEVIEPNPLQFRNIRASQGEDRGFATATRNRNISQQLCAAFPLQRDIDMLCAVKYDSTIYLHQIWYNPVIDLSQGGRDVIAGLEGPPSPITHPVLLAKRMLITALFLQYFPPGSSHHFTEAPREIGLRMAEEAIKLVTTNEGLHGWTESVELILLEALWHANIGNLRRAWLALRRAMSVGQLMGLDRATAPAHFRVLDTSRIPDTQFMWHNIVYQDRYLSLILGLPCGVVDDMTEYERKVPSGLSGTTWLSLELQHSRITRRLLNRGKSTDPDSDTKELDIMLLQAAKSVPDSFWSLPSFEKPDDEQGAFWRTLAGMNQIKHYSLLSCLHLPYLMREDPDGKYEHLKVTCLMASREILRRYNAYRAAKPVLSCCRPLDFVALLASLTVMVAQMNTHRPHMTYSFLGQQRPNDRKLIEEVLTTMDRVAQLNDDAMTFQSVSLLRQLMHIESDAFAGHCYVTEEVSETESTVSEGRCTNMDKCSNVLLLDIPYFGTIRISRQQTQEADRQQTTEPYGALPADKINVLGGEPRTSSSAVAPYPVFTGGFDFSLQIGSDSNLDPFHQANYPELTATVDDWAFQGVDTAFFGSIMSNGNFNFGTDDGVDTSLR